MANAKVTSHDVARAAGVSRATVSIVLSGSDAVTISAETRARVRKAAADLNYTPNSAARMLRNGATRTVGILVAGDDIMRVDGFIPMFFDAVCGVMRSRKYHVLIEARPMNDPASPYHDLVQSQRIDGLLIVNRPTEDPHLSDLLQSGFPAVLIGTINHPSEHSVHIRARPALTAAVDRLVGLGHRRFGIVTVASEGLETTDRRLSAIRDALTAHGLTLADGAVQRGNFSAQSGHEAAQRLLQAAPDTTAIFAGNDTLALGVLGACGAAGLDVPRDMTVVGFDDLPFAAHIWPPLSTIRIDALSQGRQAALMLLDLLDGRTPPVSRIEMTAQLVWRGSDGPVRQTP